MNNISSDALSILREYASRAPASQGDAIDIQGILDADWRTWGSPARFHEIRNTQNRRGYDILSHGIWTIVHEGASAFEERFLTPPRNIPFDHRGEPVGEDWRRWRASVEKLGIIPLRHADEIIIRGCAERILASPFMKTDLDSSIGRMVISVQDPGSGLMMYQSIDCIGCRNGQVCILVGMMCQNLTRDTVREVKRTFHVRKIAFARDLAQIALGIPKPTILIRGLVQEREPPYGLATLSFNDDDIDVSSAWNHEVLNTLAECIERGEWPSYDGMQMHIDGALEYASTCNPIQ